MNYNTYNSTILYEDEWLRVVEREDGTRAIGCLRPLKASKWITLFKLTSMATHTYFDTWRLSKLPDGLVYLMEEVA